MTTHSDILQVIIWDENGEEEARTTVCYDWFYTQQNGYDITIVDGEDIYREEIEDQIREVLKNDYRKEFNWPSVRKHAPIWV